MSETRIHGYVRVSTKEQNEDRQVNALKEFGISDRDIYIDKISGIVEDRPELDRLLNVIRKDDLVVILSIDRLGRDYTLIKNVWTEITSGKGADIKILDMPILDTRIKENNIDNKFISELVLQILSYVAQKERENIKERQRQGIANAKEKGKALGRPKAEFPVNWHIVYKEWKDNKITAKTAMEKLSLKRNTFYKLAAQYEAAQAAKKSK